MTSKCSALLLGVLRHQETSSAGQCFKWIYKAASLKRNDRAASEQVSEFDCLGSGRRSRKVSHEWLDTPFVRTIGQTSWTETMSLGQNSITTANKQKDYNPTRAVTLLIVSGSRACQKQSKKSWPVDSREDSINYVEIQWNPQELVTLAPRARRNAPGTRFLITNQGNVRLGFQLS